MNRRTMMVQPKAQEEIIVLPDEYQRVEYIQSTSNQWNGQIINTGFYPSASCIIEIDGNFVTVPSTWNQSFGTQGYTEWRANAPECIYFPRIDANNSSYYPMRGGSVASSSNVAPDTNRHYFILDRGKKAFSIDGVEYSLGGTTADCITPFWFFAFRNKTGGYENLAVFRMYRAKFKDGAEKRDYIPCYRKSDGKIGLYETVVGEFLVSIGNGTFAKGADVA